MSALAKEKLFLALKKRGSVCSPSNHESQQKEGRWRSKQWVPGCLVPPTPSNVYQQAKHVPRNGSGWVGEGIGKHSAPLVFGAIFKMGEEAYIDPSRMFMALKTASCPAKKQTNQSKKLTYAAEQLQLALQVP